MADMFDFIIVGAGSAGCVLAHRLGEDASNRILLLEYGGPDSSPFIQMPGALSIPMNSQKYDWGFRSEPEPQLGGRVLHVPRGKVLGGSSSVNGMVYVRGNAADFDGWTAGGAAGWSAAEVLPYFRRAENSAHGSDAYRGGEGPLHTRSGDMRNPLYKAFLDAAAQAGYARSDNLNGERQEGFGALDMTVRNGTRWSAANAYLRPALKRGNIELETGALAARVLFEGRRAVGVAYERGGRMREARARREVILAAGAIKSPHLLQLSGIGPAAELAAQGIAVVHDLPGVGKNLQDHLEFYLQMACTRPVTLFSHTGLFSKAMIGAQWLVVRRGLGATSHFEAGGFIRSGAGVPYPDIQFHFLPLAVSYDGKSLATQHGFQAHVGPMRSKSRGSITLASADFRKAPRIEFNYMSHPDDWREMRACLRLAREIFARPAFAAFRGAELQPGAGVAEDAAVDAFIRAKVESAYHPSCACRMGAAGDPASVVDPQCRVIGVERLRVVDSSIMPQITNGNLNAPTIMIAEKASDIIRGLPPLPASDAPFHKAADWRENQR